MTDIKGAGELAILKFGSSVLGCPDDYSAAAQEVYGHVRNGEKVVAVVSALAGETDALLGEAHSVGGDPAPALVARLARVGELRSAALMGLALGRIGVRAAVVDPHEIGLVATGDPLDADLSRIDGAAIAAKLADHDVLVVPGFTAGHESHGVATLGRGGTDLSAVFFAAQLGAGRVRLIKDVDGVYAEDPAERPDAVRFGAIDYDAAAAASTGLIQNKAITAAQAHAVAIEVAAIGRGEGTLVAAGPVRCQPRADARRLRVALLGCGAVGTGVLDCLLRRPDLFDLGPVLVRHPERREGAGHVQFTADPGEALAGDPDLVIELIGGADYPAHLIGAALRAGRSVVTANKAAIARHFDALQACAEAGESHLAFAGAVGGGAPVLEAIARLRDRPGLAAIEGVMNGTANYLLSRLGEGWGYDEAVRRAQELGLAEADPLADVDGHDAADKLAILARRAFGAALVPADIPRQSLRELPAGAAEAALARGEVLKQIGRCRLRPDGAVEASVRIESLPAGHVLARTRNEENCFILGDRCGRDHAIHGKGAGRWPTTAAVFGDVLDLHRMFACVQSPPIRLSA